MKTILALINEPMYSDSFIDYTARMAEDLGYTLHLTYILNPAAYPLTPGTEGHLNPEVGTEISTRRETAEKNLKEKVGKFQNKVSRELQMGWSTQIGTTDMVINQLISEGRSDMVVLDGHDKSGVWTLGSNNMEVALKADCPAWIIPSAMAYKKFKKIIYATNYNEADIKTLKEVIELTSGWSPEITALHVTESSDFHDKAMEKGFSEMLIRETGYEKLSIKSLPDKKGEDIEETLNQYATSTKADLIVVLKENRGFLERLFTSSSTKKIIREAELPVLVFQEK